jgi:hypothetical protein
MLSLYWPRPAVADGRNLRTHVRSGSNAEDREQ